MAIRRLVWFKSIIRKILPSFIDARFRYFKKIKYYLNIFSLLEDVKNRKQYENHLSYSIPPLYLRARIGAARDIKGFLEQGETCYNNINNAINNIGYNLQNLNTILDFGCGCGRTARWFSDWAQKDNHALIGVDIDKELIDWCNNNLNFLSAFESNIYPPLSFISDKFDLIYAISVFSHLNEKIHLKWLEELCRLTKNEGIVLISIHGHYCYDYYSKGIKMEALKEGENIEDHNNYVEELVKKKFIFDIIDKKTNYGNTFIAPEYIYDKWSKYFNVINILPLGMARLQDLVILKK